MPLERIPDVEELCQPALAAASPLLCMFKNWARVTDGQWPASVQKDERFVQTEGRQMALSTSGFSAAASHSQLQPRKLCCSHSHCTSQLQIFFLLQATACMHGWGLVPAPRQSARTPSQHIKQEETLD